MTDKIKDLLELCLRCLHEDDFPNLRQQIRDALEAELKSHEQSSPTPS